MFCLVQRVEQSGLVRVEQHSDENEARQRGCGLSAAGEGRGGGNSSVRTAAERGLKDGLGGWGDVLLVGWLGG